VSAILRLALPFEIDAEVDVELGANYPRPDLRTKLVSSLEPCSDGVSGILSKALDEKLGEVVPTILLRGELVGRGSDPPMKGLGFATGLVEQLR
jgi:hypothetical protein